MCAECHSTNVKKNYRPGEDSYDSTWSEIEVSCEACHGPASQHLVWADAVARKETPLEVEHLGLAVRLEDPGRDSWLVNPETGKGMRLAPPVETAEVETCARCHSRRAAAWHLDRRANRPDAGRTAGRRLDSPSRVR